MQDRRHLDDDELQTVADGRVFTGHQAVPLKLVDEIGDERTGIAWLAKEKNIDAKLPVRDYRLHDRFRDLPFLHAAAAVTLTAAGFGTLAQALDEWGAMRASSVNLDGLWPWHPALLHWRFGTAAGGELSRGGAIMIKSELVQRISGQNPHLYQRDVEKIVNAILGEIIAAMARGDRVELRGFGAFSVKKRPARTGRNPRTGAHVSVDQKCVPFFKTGKEMRERLNQAAEA